MLHDESYEAFRTALYRRARTEWRRQPPSRWPTALLALAACVALTATGVWLAGLRPIAPAKPTQVAGGLTIVRSEPLAANRVVRTNPQQPVFTLLSDDQLLALFPDRPVALAALPSGGKKLLWLEVGEPAEPTP